MPEPIAVPAGFGIRLRRTTRWLSETLLVGGSPTVVVRLSAAAAAAVRGLDSRGFVMEAAPTDGGLARRLLDADLAEPRLESEPRFDAEFGRVGPDPAAISVVVPARNAGTSLPGLLSSLPPGLGEVVVVDDASSDGTGCVASGAGARVVKGDGRGPAAARNRGLAEVKTPYVLFLDADTVVTDGAVERLAAHLADPALAAVAPRIVASRTDTSLLARYEAARSPLDAGPDSGRVRRGSRVAFVPSAAVLVRRDALIDVGGFDEQLSTGEDIDLEWRLDEAGWAVRYEADAVVGHDHRVGLAALISRRVAYGRPSAALDRRHPGSFAAVVTEPTAAVAMIVAAGAAVMSGPGVGAVVGAALAAGSSASSIASLVREGVPVRDAADLVAKDQVVSARSALFAVTRPWLPAALVLAAGNRRARRAVVAVLVARHLSDWRRLRPPIGPAQWVALRVVDDLAFSIGLWSGVRTERHTGPLAVRLRRNRRESAPEWTVLARYG